METLTQLLKASGINLDPKILEASIESQGLDPQQMSDDEVLHMENFIKKQQSTLSLGGQSAPKKRGRKAAPSFQEAASLVGQQSQMDMNALVESVKAGANHFSQQAAEEMITAIADAPNQAVEHFINLAQQHKGDPASFCNLGQALVGAIFPSSEVNSPM